MVVAVTGATGFVGKALVEKLLADGHEVRVLTRNALSARLAMPSATLAGAKFYAWDTMSGAIEWYDAIKGWHRGGESRPGAPISNPWNESYKKTLVKSRLQATKRVSDAINALAESERPSLVSSSAVGFYGISKKRAFTETSKPGRDFLARLCERWEAAARETNTAVTTVRTASCWRRRRRAREDPTRVPAVRRRTAREGRQWVSWIHRDDLVNLLVAALEKPGKVRRRRQRHGAESDDDERFVRLRRGGDEQAQLAARARLRAEAPSG